MIFTNYSLESAINVLYKLQQNRSLFRYKFDHIEDKKYDRQLKSCIKVQSQHGPLKNGIYLWFSNTKIRTQNTRIIMVRNLHCSKHIHYPTRSFKSVYKWSRSSITLANKSNVMNVIHNYSLNHGWIYGWKCWGVGYKF